MRLLCDNMKFVVILYQNRLCEFVQKKKKIVCGFTNIFLFDDEKFVRFVSFTHIINSFIYSFGMSDVNSKWWRRIVIYYYFENYFVNNANFPLQRNRYATVGGSKSSKNVNKCFYASYR